MRLRALFLAVCLWGGICSSFAHGETVEPIEALRRKAVDSFNLKKYGEAEKLFYDVINTDPESAAASSATEYLKDITVRAGFLDDAIRKFTGLKLKGLIPLELPDGGLAQFSRMAGNLDLQKFLFEAVKKGGIASAHLYLISFLLDAKGMKDEASYYFKQADTTQRPENYHTIHKEIVRPLHFAEPEFYERLHFPDYSFAQLQTIPFISEQLAQEYPSELRELEDGRRIELGLGLFTDYNSNLVEKPDGGALPTDVKRQDGMVVSYFANAGVRTRASKSWSYGLEYRMWLQNPVRSDLNGYGRWSNLPAVWASWWNRTDTEFRVRYDAGLTWKNSGAYAPESRIHGPLIGLSRLWNHRYQAEFLYSFKNSAYTHDKDSDGFNHTFSARLSYPGKNNTVQPFARYTWNRDLTQGQSLSLISHRLEVGSSCLVNENLTTLVSTTLEYGIYPQSPSNRRDHLTLATARFSYLLIGENLSLMGQGEYENHGSSDPAFVFSKIDVSLGLVSNIMF